MTTFSTLNIKAQPEHFPRGTLVRANLPDPGIDSNQVYEVESIVRNAPLNHIIKTKTPCPYIKGNTATFALGCVTEIVKRGDGPVVMEPMYKKQSHHWRMTMAEDLRIFRLLKNNYPELDADIHAKTHYLISSGHDIIYFLMEKFGMFEKNVSLDLSDITAALMSQSFVHTRRTPPDEYTPSGSVYAITAPKKRVDRWFKQNFSRFLTTNKKAEKDNQEQYEKASIIDECRDTDINWQEDPELHNENWEEPQELWEAKPVVHEATHQDKGVVVTIVDPSEVSQEEKNAAADLVFDSFENSLKLMRPKEERTGRYSLGQKLIGVSFKYVSELGEMMQANVLPLKYNNDMPTEVHFVELTVEAHFKVSDRNDPQDRKDCDGYFLRDDKGVVWKNQYPHATYGQLDDSADRFFTTDEYFKSPFTFTSAHLLSDRMSSICRGIDQLMKQAEKSPNEDAKQACLAKVAQLEQLQNLITTEFKKKFPNKEFSYFPIWADRITTKEVVITDC